MVDDGNEDKGLARLRRVQPQPSEPARPDAPSAADKAETDAQKPVVNPAAPPVEISDLEQRVLGAVRQAVTDTMKDGKKPTNLPNIDMDFVAVSKKTRPAETTTAGDTSALNLQSDTAAIATAAAVATQHPETSVPDKRGMSAPAMVGIAAGVAVVLFGSIFAMQTDNFDSAAPKPGGTSGRDVASTSGIARVSSSSTTTVETVPPQTVETPANKTLEREAEQRRLREAQEVEKKKLAALQQAKEQAERETAEKQQRQAQEAERKRLAALQQAKEKAEREAAEKQQRQAQEAERKRLAALQQAKEQAERKRQRVAALRTTEEKAMKELGVSSSQELDELAAASKDRLRAESLLTKRLSSTIDAIIKSRTEADRAREDKSTLSSELASLWADEEKNRLRLEELLAAASKEENSKTVPQLRIGPQLARRNVTVRLKDSNLEITGELKTFDQLSYVIELPSSEKVTLPVQHFDCIRGDCPSSGN